MRCEYVKFLSAGCYSADSDTWIYPKHTAEAEELVYVTNGTLHICEDYNEFHVKSGSVLWLQKGHTHYGLDPSEDPLRFMRLMFSEDESGESDNTEASITLRKITLPKDNKKIDLLWNELGENILVPEYPAFVQNYLTRLLLTELSVHGTACDNSFNLQQSMSDWIKNEAPSGIRVTDVAKHFGYSEDYITRIFKSFYSKGIKSYINAVRICRIKNDLIHTDFASPVIAQKHSFHNTEALHKFFKANTGITTATFRKMYTE